MAWGEENFKIRVQGAWPGWVGFTGTSLEKEKKERRKKEREKGVSDILEGYV